MKKILYVTTVSRTINAFLIPHINMLLDKGYTVDYACSIDKEVDVELINKDINIYNIPFSRNPLHPKNYKAFKELIKIQEKNNYDIIHVHTPVASVYGRLLKLKFPNIKTIYTVHGFHFHKGAPFINWAIYYPIEKIMSKFTDEIITINKEDYEMAITFDIDRVHKLNGVGVDFSSYNSDDLIKDKVRKKLGLSNDDFVILMIAEVNKNKNHKQIIEAVKILKNRNIDVKVVCAGDGVLLESIKEEIKKEKLDENILMLGFRTDIDDLIASCDVGVLMSYREGLPKNIMELMAGKKPVIGTDIRGIRDLVIDGCNGFLVKVGDSEDTARKIELLKNNNEMLVEFSENAYEFIHDYSIDVVNKQLGCIY